MEILRYIKFAVLITLAMASNVGFAEEAGNANQIECPKDATSAETCLVDKPTYIGWRTFHTHCFQCHGGSALGSTFAPSLLDRLDQTTL